MNQLKRILYFPVAHYFRFFAKIQLLLWKPRIIVITGSNAKTTLLHLLESQVGNGAKYSHHANSAYGIPFDILGLKRESLTIEEWPVLFLSAPLKAFKKPPTENLYVVEADCDRPGEGKFLSTLLKPEVCIWINISKSHTMNFEKPLEENIAHEFGYFIEYTKKIAVINGDSSLIKQQLPRAKAHIVQITKQSLKKYTLNKNSTEFLLDNKIYKFNYLLPEESFYQIMAVLRTLEYFNLKSDLSFSKFVMPPGRCSVFKGIKNSTLIDSSYNATLSSVKVILKMFNKIPTNNKWLVLGDILEQGSEEKSEHENLAEVIKNCNLENIILVGPRLAKYTYPKLNNKKVVSLINPKETLDYLNANLKGGETILFKGARFLEGIIEHLLLNKKDIAKLCRREKIWQDRRKKWNL
ncbi:MAG: Mur ligase family protein [Candidatus Daviesbacteria bacterium]|nr:Mur ligase family protein [Candidatus Daviesbacteria bacterium]